jgi:hypothetical protein
MSSAGAVSTPQIAQEHGLEVTEKLDGVVVPKQQIASPAKEQANDQMLKVVVFCCNVYLKG